MTDIEDQAEQPPQPLNSAPVQGPVEGRGAAEIRALCDAATPGPWLPFFTMHGDPYVVPEGRPWPSSQIAAVSTRPRDYGKADAQFIAAARDLVPQLLAEVEAAHRFERSVAGDSARLAAVEELVEQARKVSPSGSMTVYVGDLEVALSRRAKPVRGIVGAES